MIYPFAIWFIENYFEYVAPTWLWVAAWFYFAFGCLRHLI